MRGFDRHRNQFADFVINRIETPSLLNSSNINDTEKKAADHQWHQIVELHLVPHPSLQHAKTIEQGYGMGNGRLDINVRAAVAGYVLRRWNVDCSINHDLKGPEYHLCLENRQALAAVENLILAPGCSTN